MKLMTLTAIGLASLILVGCASLGNSMTCPGVTPYTPEFQRQAAGELGKLGPGSATGTMMTDYGNLRNNIRQNCGG